MVAQLEVAKPRFSKAPHATQQFPCSKHSPTLHSRAPICTSQIPSSALPGAYTGHPKSRSQALRLQQFPRSKQAHGAGSVPSGVDTEPASSLASPRLQRGSPSPETQPACADPSPAPHLFEPPGTSISSLHPGTALVLQEVPRAGQEHAAPCPQHLPTASRPRTNHSQTKSQNPAQFYLASPLCSGGPDLAPQQAPHLQPSALSSSSCFITSCPARWLCLPDRGPAAAEPTVVPIPLLPPRSSGF